VVGKTSASTKTFSQGSNGATSPPQPAPSFSETTSTTGFAVSTRLCLSPWQSKQWFSSTVSTAEASFGAGAASSVGSAVDASGTGIAPWHPDNPKKSIVKNRVKILRTFFVIGSPLLCKSFFSARCTTFLGYFSKQDHLRFALCNNFHHYNKQTSYQQVIKIIIAYSFYLC
jgi:hypothetical protein